jgi:hypothetical protein
MQRGLGFAFRLSIVAYLGFVAPVCAAPRTPATKSPELEKAIAELKREYAARVKSPDPEKQRKECNYFAKGPAIPLDALLAALEKPLAGVPASDGRQSAYVKWQLLSALPQTPDDVTAKRLLKIYERAPAPMPRYGFSRHEKKKLDGLLVGTQLPDDVRLTAIIEESANRGFAADAPIIAYRDELYRRLPTGRDRFVAALVDAHARIVVGADKEKLAEALSLDLPGWAELPDTDKSHAREVADLLGKLRFIESPPYYAYASVRSGKLGWRTRTDTLLTKAKFAALHKRLLDASEVITASNAPAPKP